MKWQNGEFISLFSYRNLRFGESIRPVFTRVFSHSYRKACGAEMQKTCLRVLKIVFPGKESWIEAPKMCHYASENNTLYAEIAKFPHPQSSVFAFLKCHFHIPKVALLHTQSATFAMQYWPF